MPINHDTTFVENMPRNVAVQFHDRVAEVVRPRGLPLPQG